MTGVTCVGETMVMVTPAEVGRLEEAELFQLRPGGAESNVAVGLAALGHEASWASRLGDDPLGRRVLASLRSAGVDVSLVETDPGAPTGVYFKDPGAGGTTVHYYRRGSAASRLDVSWVRRLQARPSAIVHLTGITPALSDSCARFVEEVVLGRALGDRTVSLDVNYRPGLWSAADAAPVLARLAAAADIVFVGRDEAELLWGTRTARDVRGLLPGPSWLVVKDGPAAATAFYYYSSSSSPHGSVAVPAPRVRVVEPVGAGDAFAAGFLAGHLRGLDPVRRVRLGHLVAAASLGSTSDSGPLPAPGDIERLLDLGEHDWADLALPDTPPGPPAVPSPSAAREVSA